MPRTAKPRQSTAHVPVPKVVASRQSTDRRSSSLPAPMSASTLELLGRVNLSVAKELGLLNRVRPRKRPSVPLPLFCPDECLGKSSQLLVPQNPPFAAQPRISVSHTADLLRQRATPILKDRAFNWGPYEAPQDSGGWLRAWKTTSRSDAFALFGQVKTFRPGIASDHPVANTFTIDLLWFYQLDVRQIPPKGGFILSSPILQADGIMDAALTGTIDDAASLVAPAALSIHAETFQTLRASPEVTHFSLTAPVPMRSKGGRAWHIVDYHRNTNFPLDFSTILVGGLQPFPQEFPLPVIYGRLQETYRTLVFELRLRFTIDMFGPAAWTVRGGPTLAESPQPLYDWMGGNAVQATVFAVKSGWTV